ncbi:SDR family NAD(P)-dependent oxidoreductase [Brevibacterium sp. 5221]|uniref:SDR family NAD(P)-dependent oxidoreductase n=2 Tax=Brevibacterium TaxID=1696 RepID=A0A6N9H777_9MICO|nr:SDR family oxidoreductase [Brevibacterium rongguiense]MYM19616.1 SDR family NAD(P)-dependent oxidoreductase [Brevibacterium rongguiense]
MDIRGTRAIVTGGAGGIGSALGAALAQRGAHVVLADIDPGVAAVAEGIGAGSFTGDTATSEGIAALLDSAREQLGGIDAYFANAGIMGPRGIGEDEADWDRIFETNVRAHIRAAKALLPEWTERGSGCFVTTASAAGLLTQLGQAGYSVTKHAAVGFAEWLSITYGDAGVQVTCLCPMAVDTAMLQAGAQAADPVDRAAAAAVTSAGAVLAPAEVAECVLAAVEAGQFLALPHPEVLEMYRMKGSDYDRWLRGMRRYQRQLLTAAQAGERGCDPTRRGTAGQPRRRQPSASETKE